MNAVIGLGQAEFGTSAHRRYAELAPLADQVGQCFLAGPPVDADGDEVDRRGGFQAGVRQQQRHKVLAVKARTGRLENEADIGVLA